MNKNWTRFTVAFVVVVMIGIFGMTREATEESNLTEQFRKKHSYINNATNGTEEMNKSFEEGNAASNDMQPEGKNVLNETAIIGIKVANASNDTQIIGNETNGIHTGTGVKEGSNATNTNNTTKTVIGQQDMSIRAIQIDNYKRGVGLMVNLHVTHHAGTSFCRDFARHYGPAPSFACMNGDGWPEGVTSIQPWLASETDRNIDLVRPKFHMISWEVGQFVPLAREPRLVDWENPRLLSIIIMRHPMDRLLAGDGRVNRMFGLPENRTTENWWKMANDRLHTDNYALRILSDSHRCCDGANTSHEFVLQAQAMMKNITFILDQACLDDNLKALAKVLNLTYQELVPYSNHPPARERIGNDTLYEYLLARNREDIALYNWSKTQSLVRCQEAL